MRPVAKVLLAVLIVSMFAAGFAHSPLPSQGAFPPPDQAGLGGGQGNALLQQDEGHAPETRGGQPKTMTLGPSGDLTFVLEGWDPTEEAELQLYLDEMYPRALQAYGPPFFTQTVTVLKNESWHGAGSYNWITNTIILRGLIEETLAHEMIHAFRDDYTISSSSFEEGNAVSLEGVLMDDAYYGANYYSFKLHESQDRPEIASKGGSFVGTSRIYRALRYILSGYAWLKVFIEDQDFYVNFNRHYFDNVTGDYQAKFNESLQAEIAEHVKPYVEGLPFEIWYSSKDILNTTPSQGPQLLNLWFSSGVQPNHYERDHLGRETFFNSTPVAIAVRGYDGTLLTQSAVLSGEWYRYLPLLPANYTGRLRFDVTAQAPGDWIHQTLYGYNSSKGQDGIFGIVRNRDEGEVSLYHDGMTRTVPLENGTFFFGDTVDERGTYVLNFTHPGGPTTTRVFTKTFGPYYVPVDHVYPSNLTVSETTHNSTTLTWDAFDSPHFRGYALYESRDGDLELIDYITENRNSTVLELSHSSNYSYVLQTISESVSYAFSDVVHVQTPPPPVTLREPAHEDLTESNVSVHWTVVEDCEPLTTRVYLSNASGELGTPVLVSQNGSLRHTVIGDLEQSKMYFATVEIIGENGESAFSDEVSFVALPTPPVIQSVGQVTSSSALLTWESPTYHEFLRYELLASYDNATFWTLNVSASGGTVTSYTYGDLLPATQYHVRVRTVCSNSSWAFSEIRRFATLPTPVQVNATSYDRSLKVFWTQAAEQNFSRYDVYVSLSEGELGTRIESLSDRLANSLTLNDLTRGPDYLITVAVVSAHGEVSCSNQAVAPFEPRTDYSAVMTLLVAMIAVALLFAAIRYQRRKRYQS